MFIYHGSEKRIKKPEYGAGKKYNDYGFGFYCTEHWELAAEWAVDENRNGYVNKYEIPLDKLKVLNLNSEKYNVLNWMAILLENRLFEVQSGLAMAGKKYLRDKFLVDYDKYDVIVGYRADDSYFSYAQDFLDNGISVEQLSTAMKLGELGEQIVLKSKKAFSNISFVLAERVSFAEWYDKKKKRDNFARKEYFEMRNRDYRPGELYLNKMMDEGIGGKDVFI